MGQSLQADRMLSTPWYASFTIAVFVTVYAFEAVVRYGLNLVGADAAIFLRDGLMVLCLVGMFVVQGMRQRLHPAFLIFLLIVALHGLISAANLRMWLPAVYGAKVFLSMLLGAVAAGALMNPSRAMVRLALFLWWATLIGVVLDKFVLDFPWKGLQTNIGGVEVNIGRAWATSEVERVGAFARSSIHIAHIAPLLALLLLAHLKSVLLRLFIAVATVLILAWVTQKGAILAFAVVLVALAARRRDSLSTLKWAFFLMLPVQVFLPILSAGVDAQDAGGVFSLSSFYDRMAGTWPHAWTWVENREVPFFGVGLGGISGAQRFYAPDYVNYADNMFVFLYASFGLMAVVYLAWIALAILRLRVTASPDVVQALSVLLFLFTYGIVLSIVEDQAGGLFMGAAISWLGTRLASSVRPTTLSSALVLKREGECG